MYKLIKQAIFATFVLALALSSLATIANPKGGQGKGSENKGQSYTTTKGSQSKGAENKGQSSKPSSAYKSDNKSPFSGRFSTDDQKTILNYFHSHNYQYSTLPPGIAKNLARGKPLPPGIAKNYIPNDLAGLLNISPNYDYFMVGNNIAAVEKSTGIIADFFDIK